MEKILVMGIGKSGMAAVKLLYGKAELSVWDVKPEEELDSENVVWLKDHAVKCFFAVTPNEEFDRVIISPGIKPDNEVAKLGKELLGELELAYETCKGTFIAITGTNGKTTTTTLTGLIAQAEGLESFTVGNALMNKFLPIEPGQARTYFMVYLTAIFGALLYFIIGKLNKKDDAQCLASLKEMNVAMKFTDILKLLGLAILMFAACYTAAGAINTFFEGRFMLIDGAFDLMKAFEMIDRGEITTDNI